MKKFTWLLVGILGVAVVFGSISLVSAGTGNGTAMRNGVGNAKGVLIGKVFENFQSDIANYIGISVETLQAERLEGKSLAKIASEHGKTEDDLIQFIVSKKVSYLKDLLSQGKINQTQYDNAVKRLTERTKTMVERTEVGKPSFADFKENAQGNAQRGTGFGRKGVGNGTCVSNTPNP